MLKEHDKSLQWSNFNLRFQVYDKLSTGIKTISISYKVIKSLEIQKNVLSEMAFTLWWKRLLDTYKISDLSESVGSFIIYMLVYLMESFHFCLFYNNNIRNKIHYPLKNLELSFQQKLIMSVQAQLNSFLFSYICVSLI